MKDLLNGTLMASLASLQDELKAVDKNYTPIIPHASGCDSSCSGGCSDGCTGCSGCTYNAH